MAQLICQSHELEEGECRSFMLAQQEAFIVRKDGKVSGFINSCPHRSVPLNWQANKFMDGEGELIQCATHGALFLTDTGRCVAGPCINQFLTAILVTEKDRQIYAEHLPRPLA